MMGNDHMGHLLLTDMTENITFPQFYWQPVPLNQFLNYLNHH